MTDFENRVRDELHRSIASLNPPADLNQRVLDATVFAPAPDSRPDHHSGRPKRYWLMVAATIVVVAALSIGISVAAGSSRHHETGLPLPTAPTRHGPSRIFAGQSSSQGLPSSGLTSSSASASSAPTANGSSSSQPSQTGPGTPTGPWYQGLSLTPLTDAMCPGGAASVDQRYVLANVPEPVVVVQGHCVSAAASWFEFIGFVNGSAVQLLQLQLPAPAQNVQSTDDRLSWTYQGPATGGVNIGGDASWSEYATVAHTTVVVSPTVDSTPQCDPSVFGHGTLNYRQGVVDGVVFLAPHSPCWVPMSGFSLTTYDAAGHVVLGPYSGITIGEGPRFYVTSASADYYFFVTLNLGLTTYDAKQCESGEIAPATTVKIRYSWGVTVNYTIAPEWMCQTAAGGMSLGNNYPD